MSTNPFVCSLKDNKICSLYQYALGKIRIKKDKEYQQSTLIIIFR